MKRLFRKLKVFYIKVIRSNGSPHGIALSVAIGFFIGLFLPVGTQTIPVLILAWILRVDKFIAFLITWVSNPYTCPFLYVLFAYTGAKIVGSHHTFAQIKTDVIAATKSLDWSSIKELGIELGTIFFVGSFVWGLVVALLSYFITKNMVVKYRNRRKRAIKSGN